MRHFSRVFIACRAPSNSYRVHPSPVPVPKSAILFLRLRMLAVVSVPTFHLKTAPGSRAQFVVGWKSHSRRISRLKQPRFYWCDSVDHTDGAMETPIEMLLDTRLP